MSLFWKLLHNESLKINVVKQHDLSSETRYFKHHMIYVNQCQITNLIENTEISVGVGDAFINKKTTTENKKKMLFTSFKFYSKTKNKLNLSFQSRICRDR
jgi:hypothetical protein